MSITTREPLSSNLDDSYEPDRNGIELIGPQDELATPETGRNLVFDAGITRYVEPLVNYRNLLIGSVFVSILLGWLVLLIMPRSFESTGKLQLLVGRESVGLDPSSTTSQTMLLQKTAEEDVNSALEILGSRAIAEAVVDELGVENILNGTLPSSPASAHSSNTPSLVRRIQASVSDVLGKAYDLSGLRDKVSTRERAVTELQNKIDVFSPKKSSTLIIEARSKSPEMAQAIVDCMIKKFMEMYVNVATTEGSYQFFESQSLEAEKKLNGLLDKRKQLLQDEKLASVDSKYKSLTEQLSAIESEILKSDAQLKKILAEVQNIELNMSKVDKEIVATLQTQPDVTVSNMRTALYQAELEETRLAEMLQADNPRLIAIRKQIVSARAALDELEGTSDSISKTPNPTWLKLEGDLLKAKTAAKGLESFLQQNQAQKQNKLTEINQLLEFDNHLRQVDREIDVATKSLSTLKEKEEQSRVIEGLRQQLISSVSVAQPPSFIEKPVSPKKPVLALAFVSFGLLTGVGLVYLREFTRKTLRRPEEIERLLKYPVLTELGNLRALGRSREPNPQLLRSRRCHQLLEACQGIQSELMLSLSKSEDSSRQARRIGIIGVNDGCGASSIAMAMAIVCTEREALPTVLIDLDAKKGTTSKGHELAHPGMVNRVRRRGSTGTAPTESLTDEGLKLIGCQASVSQTLLRGSADEVARTLNELGRSNEFIIVDFPPANRSANSIAVAQHLDQIIVVIASDQTETKTAVRLMHQLEQSHAEVVGVVVNKSKRYLARWLEGFLG